MRTAIAVLGLWLGLTAASLPPTESVSGIWRTQMHGALVEIRGCASAGPCAYLAWVDPAKAKGVTSDQRNPDPSLRNRPLVGVPIVWGLRRGNGEWTGGRVYNPETGQIFRSAMKPLADGRLKVTGCWGPLCRSETWVRANVPATHG